MVIGISLTLISSYNCFEVINPLEGVYFSRQLLNDLEIEGLLSVVLPHYRGPIIATISGDLITAAILFSSRRGIYLSIFFKF